MEFRTSKPSDYISIVIPYVFPVESTPSIRHEILEFLASEIPDEEVREFLLTFLSLSIECRNRHQLAAILTGVGSNGKGVLKNLMEETLGLYHNEPSAQFLTSEKLSDESLCPNLVRLKAKRSVFMSEPEQGRKMNGAFLKFITGKDIIQARNLNSKGYVKYKPRFTPVLLCNAIPKID
ncbi:hypothetical protein BDK51DRAFT_39370 [Blyttiomyces helicus]|uniref:SF3 helicase domain-containing protein n=1 Tax=Blyttiomyces helicus TaxID=388810 RepID=A0A4P9WBP2_9FUNG|nr:hypothetical protein BDK51DRAFT_39370 [Blyttiomyces helicus]|eukprot:RKO89035.1 hypothetical protein BDK51DRAFT_39370 [Blyttiomyces helicus]